MAFIVELIILAQLNILHAGSLSAMMDEVARDFTKETGIKITRRAGGSLFLSRLIKERRVDWDIFFSADYRIIEDLKPAFCEEVIPFAGNEMVIAYTNKSKYSKEIREDNWIEILSKPNLRIGRANPELDPCGYRALLIFEIAKKLYPDKKNLVDKILQNSSEKNVRPKAAEVANLLESGEIDYAFLYLSEALTRNVKYIKLSDSLNFSNLKLNDFYNEFYIKLKNSTEIRGDPIIYAYCVNKNSKNKKAINDFLSFWDKKYREYLKKYNFQDIMQK